MTKSETSFTVSSQPYLSEILRPILSYSENVLALFQALELDAAVLDTNPDPFECLCEALERKYKKEGSSEPSAGDDDAQKGEDEDMHSAD